MLVTTQYRFGVKIKFGDPSDCWNWLGYINYNGYGQFLFEDKQQLAPRVMYQIVFGPIPIGLCILHRCDNPACVNPWHLFLGTYKDNMKDCVSKGRHISGGGPKTILLELVTEIRDRHLYGYATQRKLAKEYGVSRATIWNVINKIGAYHA